MTLPRRLALLGLARVLDKKKEEGYKPTTARPQLPAATPPPSPSAAVKSPVTTTTATAPTTVRAGPPSAPSPVVPKPGSRRYQTGYTAAAASKTASSPCCCCGAFGEKTSRRFWCRFASNDDRQNAFARQHVSSLLKEDKNVTHLCFCAVDDFSVEFLLASLKESDSERVDAMLKVHDKFQADWNELYKQSQA